MHEGRRDLKVVLEVALCWWPAIESSVGVEEGQVLALGGGKAGGSDARSSGLRIA
jgi:hypothetical protein